MRPWRLNGLYARLFKLGEEGEPAATVQRSIDFLGRVARSRRSTDRAAEALAAEGVIERWPAQVRIDGKPRRLGGLYHASERALNGLDPEALSRLRDAGALGIAYAQLLSARALRTLEQAVAAREQEQRAQLPAEAVFSDAPLEDRIDWDALDFGDEGADERE